MDGRFSVDVMGEEGAMVMFSLMMGEGDEMMEYMADSDAEVMVGMPGDIQMANLMAFTDDSARPTAVPPTRSPQPASRPRWPQGPHG